MSAVFRTTGAGQGRSSDAGAPQGRQYLTFLVTGEIFAIAISSIKEIIEYRPPTDVPMMPAFMRGVINLRGRVVPVIDLSARFGRGRSEPTRRSCIVIVEVAHEHQQELGIAVDGVSAVLEIADADIEPPPDFGARLRADFISGMGKLGERFVIILAIDKVLSIDELTLLGGAAGPAAEAVAAAGDSAAP